MNAKHWVTSIVKREIEIKRGERGERERQEGGRERERKEGGKEGRKEGER